jgi:hypothetical protein
MALVLVTALVTGVVVASWVGRGDLDRTPVTSGREPLSSVVMRMALAPQSSAQATPPRSIVETCNRQAAREVGTPSKTREMVKDAGIGAVLGAAVGKAGGGTLFGLSESRKHDATYRDAYGRCMRSRGYAS